MRSLRIVIALAGKQLRILFRLPAILAVLFVPGVVMYTIFTLIFSGPAGRPFRIAIVDEDQSAASRALVAALAEGNVVAVRTADESADGPPLTAELARRQIRGSGKYRVAVVIPQGYGLAPNVLSGARHAGVQLIYDETQPMEADAVLGMLQMAAGRQLFSTVFEPLRRVLSPATSAPATTSHPAEGGLLLKVERRGVAITRMQIAAKHTFLAGIVPMFLLFGATGAARTLLEEIENGQMKRLLAAPIAPAHILCGTMLQAFALSLVQCYGLYLFAWLVFGVAIWNIAGGLFVLTVCTCLAVTGFGMLLGALCRTSQHLDSIGTVVILAMSAIGGSMVPRFVMPAFMQQLGLFTINGWAYDGFIALIRNEGWAGIAPACGVLVGVAAAMAMCGSVVLGRRLRNGSGG